jgi:hypothetical protein
LRVSYHEKVSAVALGNTVATALTFKVWEITEIEGIFNRQVEKVA